MKLGGFCRALANFCTYPEFNYIGKIFLPTIRAAIRNGTDYSDANVVNEQALQFAIEAEKEAISTDKAT